jgi:hypothetical protein
MLVQPFRPAISSLDVWLSENDSCARELLISSASGIYVRGRRVASSTASVPKQVINPSRSSISIGVITDSYTAISFNSSSGSRNTCATSDSTDRNSGSSITETGSTKISSTTRDFPQWHSLTTLPNKKKPGNAE